MFGSLQSPAPVVDCLRSDGGAGHFWQTARSIGIAAQTSTFDVARRALLRSWRSEEHTSELQSLMRISYAVFCLKNKTTTLTTTKQTLPPSVASIPNLQQQ